MSSAARQSRSGAETATAAPDLFPRYAAAIRSLPTGCLSRGDLLRPDFQLYSEAGLSVYYAPFDSVNAQARVALTGITPGWSQMEIAHRVARAELTSGTAPSEASRRAKVAASFAGVMRSNLVAMLDGIGLPAALGLGSSAELFGPAAPLLHTTSAVRYPVFVAGGENYSGMSPRLMEARELRRYVLDVLAPELDAVPHALVVPLGAAVKTAVLALTGRNDLDVNRCLLDFPHPSPQNRRRDELFARNRGALSRQVRAWFDGRLTRQRDASPPPLAIVAEPPVAADATALPPLDFFKQLTLRALTELGGRAQRHAIRRRAVESSGLSADQLAVAAPRSKRAQYASMVDYQLSWALTHLKNDGVVTNPERGVWGLQS